MYTRATKNLGLPQYVDEDHPDFLGEINVAYEKIDQTCGELIIKTKQHTKELESIRESIESLNETIKTLIGGNNNG